MSYAPGRSLPPRPYGTRPPLRPTYGARPPIGGGLGPAAGSGALGGAIGAIGGTLGCLLCLAAIGALGLFSCVVAITAYTKQFLNSYKSQPTFGSSGAGQIEVGLVLLVASLFYTIICRMQRS